MYHLICTEPVLTIKVDHIKCEKETACETIQKVLTPFLLFEQSVSILVVRESIDSGDLTLIVQGKTKVDIKLSNVWDTTDAEKAASKAAFVIVQSVLLALADHLSGEEGTLDIEIARE